MQKYYLENRIWYVGYTWINLDSEEINHYAESHASEFDECDARTFRYNKYAGDDGKEILYVSYHAKHLEGKFTIPHYDAAKTLLEFKFMSNGCVNVLLTFVPSDPDNFAEHIKNIDAEGAESFTPFSDDILSLLIPLLQNLIDKKIIECNETSLWGIPSLLSKKALNLANIAEFGMTSEQMHGRKTLHWSVLYNQHVISDDEADYAQFSGIRKELTLHKPLKNSKGREILHTSIGNWKLYWKGGENELDDIKCFIEGDAVLLSKFVILSTSIDFNTELSLILLKDNQLCTEASVDELRKPTALLRTHLACTEMYVPSFSEELLAFYEQYDELESKFLQSRILQQKEAEETLMQIANTTTLTKNDIKAEWFQFFLVALSAMTVFSVIQDVTSFILVDSAPDPEVLRLSLFMIVLVLVGALVYANKPESK